MATVVIKLDGVDITADVVFAQPTNFRSLADGQPGTAVVLIDDEQQAYTPDDIRTGMTLELFIDGQREWDGWAFKVRRAWPLPVDDTSQPVTVPRFWIIEGYDRNILFQKRFMYRIDDPANNEGFTIWPTDTSDKQAIDFALNNYVDLSGDDLDIESGIEQVASPGPFEEFTLGYVSAPLGVLFDDAAKITGAVFYIDPDRVLRYIDDRTVTAPFVLSDAPTAGQVGYREAEAARDYTDAGNEALIWGAGLGSADPVFAKYTDTDRVALHGLWQYGEVYVGAWKQQTVNRRARTYVEGSPSHRRGHNDPVPVVTCSLFTPGIRVGHVVDFRMTTFDYQEDLPVRSSTITFLTPTEPRWDIELTLRVDTPFGVPDLWKFAFPSPFDISETIPPEGPGGIGGASPMTYVLGTFFSDGANGPTFEGLYAQSAGDRAFISAFADDGPPTWNLLMNDDMLGAVGTYRHPDDDPYPSGPFPATEELEVWSAAADATGLYVNSFAQVASAGWDSSWVGIHKYSPDGTPLWTTFMSQSFFSGDGQMVLADGYLYLFWGGDGNLLQLDPGTGSVMFFRELLTGPDSGLGHVETSYGYWPNTPPASPYNYLVGSGYRINAYNESPWRYYGFTVGVWPLWLWDPSAGVNGFEQREWVGVGPRLDQYGIRAKIEFGNADTVQIFDFTTLPGYTGSGSIPAYSVDCPIEGADASLVGQHASGEWFDISDDSNIRMASPGGITVDHTTAASAIWEDLDDPTTEWLITTEEFFHDRSFYAGLAKGPGDTYYMVSRPIARTGVTVTGFYQVHRYGPTGGPQATADVSVFSTSTRSFRLVTHPDRGKFYLIRREASTWYLDEWDGSTMTFIKNIVTKTSGASQAIADGVGVDESTGNIIVYSGSGQYGGYSPDGAALWTLAPAFTYTGASMAAFSGKASVAGSEFHGSPDFFDSPVLLEIDGATGGVIVAPRGWAADAVWDALPTAVASSSGGGGTGQLVTNIPIYDNAEHAGAQYYITQYPYAAGSLVVYFQGIRLRPNVDYIETDPTTGEFRILGDRDISSSLLVKYTRAGSVPTSSGGEVYRPAPQLQYGWGTPMDGYNAIFACSAMALDRHTLGANTAFAGTPRNTPPNHRGFQSDQSTGGGLDDVETAWSAGWGETFYGWGIQSWSAFVTHIDARQGAVLQGIYSNLPASKRLSNFTGAHAIYINERFANGNFWGIDPLYRYPTLYTTDELKAYAAGIVIGADTVGYGSVSAGYTKVT